MEPLSVLCRAKNECASEAPISQDCIPKLKKGAEAFCNCSKQGRDFVKSDASCSSTMDRVKAYEAAADGHHDLDHHQDHSFDFCDNPQKDVCGDYFKGLRQRMLAAMGSTPSPSA